jgi:hypothetical protein
MCGQDRGADRVAPSSQDSRWSIDGQCLRLDLDFMYLGSIVGRHACAHLPVPIGEFHVFSSKVV